MGHLDPHQLPLARLLALSYEWMIDQLHNRLANEGWTGLRRAYGFVLLAVRHGSLTPTELGTRLQVSKQAASKLAHDMVEAGLLTVEIDPTDTRQRRLALAQLGHELLANVERVYADLEREWAEVMGPHALEETRRRLQKTLITLHDGDLPALKPLDRK